MNEEIKPLEDIIYGLDREERVKELVNMTIENVKSTESAVLLKIEQELKAYDDPRLKILAKRVDREIRIRRILDLSTEEKCSMKLKENRETLIEIYELSDPRLDNLQGVFERVHKILCTTPVILECIPIWEAYRESPLPVPPKKEEENIIVSESSDDEFDTSVSCKAGKHRKEKEE